MVVRDGVLLDGTVGGGRLELEAIEQAQDLLDDASAPRSARMNRALGPELAQCCGGRVELMIERVERAQAEKMKQAMDEASGQSWTTAAGALHEQVRQPVNVVVFGAGHVSRALAKVLTVQPWQMWVVDHRAQWAVPTAFPSQVMLHCRRPVEALRAWGWLGHEPQESGPNPHSSYVVVMTHDHNLDQELVAALLQGGPQGGALPLAYLGLIGSKTKIRSTYRRLKNLGIGDKALDTVIAPIGLKDRHDKPIGGKRPGDIAISVAAQLLCLISPDEP
tara:strand:- start:407 stop:1237 length:831 start_codon:yes stop_codon:yes gene_type:complete